MRYKEGPKKTMIPSQKRKKEEKNENNNVTETAC